MRWDECPELADCAESFKNGMMQLRPRERRTWDAVLGKNPAFWNRISLHHLRMAGKRHWYAIVHSLDEAHRLLVLKIPPVKFVSEAARDEHARRQMTYRDDERGRFAAGLRNRRLIGVAGVHSATAKNDHLQVDANLRRCEAGTVGVRHRVEQILHQLI